MIIKKENKLSKLLDKKRDCKIHGRTLFKYKHSTRKSTGKTSEWYVCNKCLKQQWKKASAKRRKIPSVRKYQKNYQKSIRDIYKQLFIYLKMLLLISKNMPE